MLTVMSWLGFFGVWTLFGGAVYQASLELRAHEVADARFRSLGSELTRPPQVSSWWWLVPPVKFMLERKRAMKFRKAYVEAISVEDFAALLSFLNKATGWLLVASGGLMLAVKETYQFTLDRRVGLGVFCAIVIAMTLGSVGGCFVRLTAAEKLLRQKKGDPPKPSSRP